MLTYDTRRDALKLISKGISDEGIMRATKISRVGLDSLRMGSLDNPLQNANETDNLSYSKVLCTAVEQRLLEMGDAISTELEKEFNSAKENRDEIDMDYMKYLSVHVNMYTKMVAAFKRNNINTVINIAQEGKLDLNAILDSTRMGQ